MRQYIAYLLIPVFVCLGYVAQAQQPVDSTEAVIDYSDPKEYTIGGITVSGTQFLDPDILVAISGIGVGDRITIPGDAISNSLSKLWDQGLFTDVQIRITKTIGNTAFLDIALVERPRLNNKTFPNTKKSESDDLAEKIQLVKGRVVTENSKVTIANVVKNYYRDKGFLDARVTIKEVPVPNQVNLVNLEIVIEKGKKIKIAKISFEGVEQVSTMKLKKKMKDTKEKVRIDLNSIFNIDTMKAARKEKIKLGTVLENLAPTRTLEYLSEHVRLNVFSTSKFKKADYEKDKNSIIAYYNSMGYRDATITADTVYLDNNELKINIKIDEGGKYYFRNISWKGNTIYSSIQLDSILGIHKGDVYNQELLDTRLNMNPSGRDVSTLYMDDGYLFFQVTPLEVAVVGDSIDLEIRINEGPQATINEVRIMGNTKTKEYVIRRELYTIPGNKFSRSDLIRSQREIANLGYFDTEQMEVVPMPNPEKGTVDIEYRLVEKPNDQLELSAGWGGRGRGVVGTLGVTFTNFSIQNLFKKGTWSPLPSGDGQKLSLRVQTNGRIYQSYNASFTEPWLGGKKPNSFTISWYHTRFANLNSNNEVTGRLITNGASLGLGIRLKKPDNFFTFQALLNYQNYTLDNWVSSNFIITDGSSNNLSLKFILARNSVDQPIYPRRGSNIMLSLQVTPPYSFLNGKDYTTLTDNQKYKWIEYHKWRFTAEWFTPLTRKEKMPIVLRMVAKFGFLGYYNKDIGYSPFERFELGGDGLSNISFYGRDIIALRGYEVITPSTGAPFFNKFTMELRFPFSLNQSATIYSTAFVEAGNYYMTIKDYNPFKLNRTAGLGLRIFLPMFGMLGFDYGIGFDKNAGNTTGFGNFLGQYGKFSIVLGFEPD
ncbi:MAG: POTRA domain-containing protein [Chitinophagales bacterium]|nr:POTRA domain-containing protein [Chitinophagales bacterium]